MYPMPKGEDGGGGLSRILFAAVESVDRHDRGRRSRRASGQVQVADDLLAFEREVDDFEGRVHGEGVGLRPKEWRRQARTKSASAFFGSLDASNFPSSM